MSASARNLSPPTLQTLVTRVRQWDATCTHDAKAIADAISRHALEGAVCAGAVINGKWRALRFEDYYEAVSGLGLDGKRVKAPRVARKRKVA